MADLDKTMSRIAANSHDGNVVPAWRLEHARRERERRTRLVNSTIVIASGLLDERDDEAAEA